MEEHNATIEPPRRMLLRMGVNLGDVIHDDTRVYGDGVNIASRLESLADPGGICLLGEAFAQVQRKLALGFTDLGEQQLKNIAQPIRVYRIERQQSAPALPSQKPALPLPDKPSISVLSFTNLNGDSKRDQHIRKLERKSAGPALRTDVGQTQRCKDQGPQYAHVRARGFTTS